MPTDHIVYERGVADGARHWPDLVEGGRKGNNAVSAHTAVGGLDAHCAGKRRWLANGTARVASDGHRSLPGRHSSR